MGNMRANTNAITNADTNASINVTIKTNENENTNTSATFFDAEIPCIMDAVSSIHEAPQWNILCCQ